MPPERAGHVPFARVGCRVVWWMTAVGIHQAVRALPGRPSDSWHDGGSVVTSNNWQLTPEQGARAAGRQLAGGLLSAYGARKGTSRHIESSPSMHGEQGALMWLTWEGDLDRGDAVAHRPHPEPPKAGSAPGEQAPLPRQQ